MAAFTHLDSGTDEAVWESDGRLRSIPELLLDVDHLIVVAAHPDDETLGAGGLIRRLHENGARVSLVLATDGEASHPHSTTHTPDELRLLRRTEVSDAVGILAPTADVTFFGLPDGGLRENVAELARSLDRILDERVVAPERILVVAPWSGDGHRDHRAAAEVANAVAAHRGLRQLGYPIWLWHWGRPDDVPWDLASSLDMTRDERAAKERAMSAHVSQVHPLSAAEGDEAIVSRAMLSHFARDVEVFFAEPTRAQDSLPGSWFDDFYARHRDPWGFETRWYEERKRAVLLASLPARELGRVLEIGCSTGLITAELSARASRVTAMDPSAAALDAARERVGADASIRFHHGSAPDQWPGGTYDTIVLSEVGYYLSASDLERAIELIDDEMSERGCLVACHWRHVVPEYPQTGDQVHAALHRVDEWEVLVRHEEADFILEVFCRRPAVSVAAREGLT